MKPITFGTDGWRAVIADDYTFQRVWAVATAYAEWLQSQNEARPILVSFDARFSSEHFAAVAASAISAKGFKVFISNAPAVTPAASYMVAAKKLAGAAIITASHNPAAWNGFKIKTSDGASSPPELTTPVQTRANAIVKAGQFPEEIEVLAPPTVEVIDFKPDYLARLAELADMELIRKAKPKVVVDIMHGAGKGYLEVLLQQAGCETIVVRSERNPSFGGVNPEPIEVNLGASIPLTKEPGVAAGFALDGDGDRLGLMADGEFINTHRTMALLALHSLKNRGERGALVRTVNMTSMIDALAAHFKVPLIEVPVGFKNIAKLMLERDVTIGGEESGGTGFSGHIPERDSCLAALRMCEFMARENKTVPQLLELLWPYVGGPYYFKRYDLRITPEQKEKILAKLEGTQPKSFAGRPVENIDSKDGRKYFFPNNEWLLIRPSGTEPLIRIYAEAKKSEGEVDQLLEAAKGFLAAGA
jgi:phosphomannomutase